MIVKPKMRIRTAIRGMRGLPVTRALGAADQGMVIKIDNLIVPALAATIGYLLKGPQGAIFGGAAGYFLGQQVMRKVDYTPPPAPGTSAPAARPGDKDFDWMGAVKAAFSTGKDSPFEAVKWAMNTWGTKERDTNVQAESAKYLPYNNEPFWSDPCANGGCVMATNYEPNPPVYYQPTDEWYEPAASPPGDYVSI